MSVSIRHLLTGVLFCASVTLPLNLRGDEPANASPAKPQFRAGAAAVEITPTAFPVIIAGNFTEQLATKALDKLYARAIVLDDGQTKIAIVVVDSCGIEAQFLDEAKRLAHDATGIPTERMLIAATHSHSAPSSWGVLGSRVDEIFTAGLIPQIARAIQQAADRLEPAQIGWMVVSDPKHTHNRRWILRSDKMQTDPFGVRSVRAMMHPGYQNPNYIGPSGPVDTDLSLIGIRAVNGRPIAALANYSQHYFGAPAVSADYYGRFSERLAELIGEEKRNEGNARVPGDNARVPGASEAPPQKGRGRGWGGAPLAPGTRASDSSKAADPPFVAIMSQGTSGDLMWMDYGAPKPSITMKQYADEVADVAYGAWQKIHFRGDAPLKMEEAKVTFRRRTPDAARLAWAKPIVEEIKDRRPNTIQEVYAKEAELLNTDPEVELKLQVIAIGDHSIAAIPNEVFALTGLKLKRASTFQTHINMSLANGTFGYIPPPEQHKLGGYTTWPARSAGLEEQAEPKIVAKLKSMLASVSGLYFRHRKNWTESRYEAAVEKSAPLVYWPLEDMESSKVYGPRSGISAIYESGVALYLEGPPILGKSGLDDQAHWGSRAAHFAGGRVRSEMPRLGRKYSIELWFWNGFPQDVRPVTGYFFSRGADGDAAAAGDHWGVSGTITPSEPGRLFFFNGNAAGETVFGHTLLPAKVWHHVVLVRDGERVRAYLNGSQEPELEGRGRVTTPDKSNTLFIGGRCDNFANFEGKLAQVAIFDHVLRPAEVEAHYVAALGSKEAAVERKMESSAIQYPDGSQPLSPADSLAAWQISPGYRVELVAAEPLVKDPVAIDWGADGKLWVAEMADYPSGIDGRGKPGGRIRYLEDTDGDGRYDRSTVFLDGISFPNGVLAWGRGVLVTAAPEIFYAEDTDGDGRAGIRRPLYTGFIQGNQQLRVNGLRLGLDNWVYCASGAHFGGFGDKSKIHVVSTGADVALGSRDFRIRPDQGLLDPQAGPSQFGRDRDDWGNWFGEQNSYPLWHLVLEDQYMCRNPLAASPDPRRQLTEEANPKVYPISHVQKRYHNFQQSGRFTSACSAMIYRDELLFPRGPNQHSFTCEPVHNLVHHRVLTEDGVSFTAARPKEESQREFLASSDPWCRPVMARTGPDGALWIVDMYRYVIEHPEWLPPDGQKELAPFLRAGEDRGRIYRVVPIKGALRPIPWLAHARVPGVSSRVPGASEAPPQTGWGGAPLAPGTRTRARTRTDVTTIDTVRLIAFLESPNGPQRDMAQRLLIAKGDAAAVEPLTRMARESASPLGRLHAMYTLEGLDNLSPEVILAALSDPNPGVRRHAVRLAESKPATAAGLIAAVAKLTSDPDAKVRLQLACTLGQWEHPAAAQALGKLAVACKKDPFTTAAVLSSVSRTNIASVVEAVFAYRPQPPEPMAERLCRMVVALKQPQLVENLIRRASRPADGKQLEAWQLASLAAILDALPTSDSKLPVSDELRPAVEAAIAQARVVTGNPKAAELTRVSAVGLLLREPDRHTSDLELAEKLLGPQTPSALQAAAVTRLARQSDPAVASVLLTPWRGYTPSIRAAVLAAVTSRPDWVRRLIAKLDDGTVRSAELSAAIRQRLLATHDKKLRQEIEQRLGAVPSDRQQALDKVQGALKLTADRSHGAVIFEKKCSACHQVGMLGRLIGPNLASLTNKTPSGLLESIIDPSRGVEAKYLNYVASLTDGRSFSGLLEVESGGSITLLGADGQRQTILRADLEELRSSGKSLMPDGLEQDLTPQDLADLIGYVLGVE
ncbi:MAG: c-type cytochrome [Planctomycetes bacterium]|nr:c-type cytochrome [Planctomycetota bacterium]